MTRLKQFLALAGLTAVEVLRQPVSLLITITALVLMGLSPLLLLHNFGESGKIVRDGAMALHMFLGFMLAGYAACSVMTRDIRTGTASAVLSKPVGRGLFYGAKFTGVVALVFLFSVCSTAGTLLAEKSCEKFYFSARITGYFADYTSGVLLLVWPALALLVGALLNLFRKRPFVTSAFKALAGLMVVALVGACFINEAGELQSFYPLYDLRLINASLLIFVGLTVVVALALLLSIKLNTVQALSALFAIFILGWMSHYFFGGRINQSIVFGILYGAIPDWQHFWMANSLSDGGVIPVKYILHAAAYAFLYSMGLLAAGAALFGNSELK